MALCDKIRALFGKKASKTDMPAEMPTETSAEMLTETSADMPAEMSTETSADMPAVEEE